VSLVIAARSGILIVPDFGEPAVHLTPVGLLKHLRIMRADLDFHLGPLPSSWRRAPYSGQVLHGKEIPGDGYALPNVQATGAVYPA
jgi:hypothetical protein